MEDVTATPLSPGMSRASSDSIEDYRTQVEEVYSVELSVRVTVRPQDRIRLDTSSANGVSVGFGTFPQMTLINLPTNRRKLPERYFIYFTSHKHVLWAKGRGSFHLRPNEVMFLSSHIPWDLTTTEPFSLTSMAIDKDWLDRYLPQANDLVGRRLVLSYNLDRVLNGLMQSALSIANAGQFSEAASDIAGSFLHAMSLALLPTASTTQTNSMNAFEVRRDQVKTLIEKHYASRHLTIDAIAERLQLSPRYIQMAFADDDATPAEYLRNFRLQVSAQMLHDPRQEGRSISDIALACGFASSAYFATQFKRFFGLSPSDFRTRS